MKKLKAYFISNEELLSQTKQIGFRLLFDINMVVDSLINLPCQGKMVQPLFVSVEHTLYNYSATNTSSKHDNTVLVSILH